MRPVQMPGGGLLIDDCYNANPSSAKAALLTLTHLVRGKGRAVAVLGGLGPFAGTIGFLLEERRRRQKTVSGLPLTLDGSQ